MSAVKILSQNEVTGMIGVSINTFYRNFYRKGKPVDLRFPQKRVFGRGKVGWLEQDIIDYMEGCPKLDQEAV